MIYCKIMLFRSGQQSITATSAQGLESVLFSLKGNTDALLCDSVLEIPGNINE